MSAYHGHVASSSYNPINAFSGPSGTFLPGTKVQVGSHRVVVDKYLSEGGFAHVYLVRLSQAVDHSEVAVLKRVAVPDKIELANMRTEVETMKKLRGHRHIVKYIDSHASQLHGGGYEVFLLMEYCGGGGLIDFMNTRLQNRLTEPEIVKIFTDVTEGVACMHYLKPPLLHRDLKVENVLISRSGNTMSYKLCDFGSAAPPRPAATTAAEGRLIEEDIQRHTTLQYRSPEMIDVYRKQPIDEKSDIWALGVLLYKLCYYTTPFEDVGQMAILNASFKFPAYPPFSDRLKLLIASMLRENPQKRPNVYEVLSAACRMQGKEVPIRDIYSHRSASEARRYHELPQSPAETGRVGAMLSPPVQEKTQVIPDIAPMRRGRPAKPGSQPDSRHDSAKPSPSPFRGPSTDPFATLDRGRAKSRNVDELSGRFPTLDQFHILHDTGGKFDFERNAPVDNKSEDAELSQRLTNALADEAFAKQSPGYNAASEKPPALPKRPEASSLATGQREFPNRLEERARQQAQMYQPVPQRPAMVSTGTMTSPPSTPGFSEAKLPSRPVYKLASPEQNRRPSSQPRPLEHERKQITVNNDNNDAQAVLPQTMSTSKSQLALKQSSDIHSHEPSSSRPSLEFLRPPHAQVSSVTRSKSVNSKPTTSKSRVPSVHASSNHDSPQRLGSARASLDLPRPKYSDGAELKPVHSDLDQGYDSANISSDIDYLRAREEELTRKREKRFSGAKHAKRTSLTKSIPGTKLLTGRFGEAFRRFESHNGDLKQRRAQSPAEKPNQTTLVTNAEVARSPEDAPGEIDGDSDDSDDDDDDISPEMRRELERRRLSQEEKRFASAAADYRRQVSEKGQGGKADAENHRSPAIQSKMRSLLNENNTSTSPKTASGYGRFTESDNNSRQINQTEYRQEPKIEPVSVSRTAGPVYGSRNEQTSSGKNSIDVRGATYDSYRQQTGHPAAVASTVVQKQSTGPKPVPPPRPVAPPKPKNLRSGAQQNISKPPSRDSNAAPSSPTNLDEWENSFSRRFPSLSRLEMVETEIEVPRMSGLRTREV